LAPRVAAFWNIWWEAMKAHTSIELPEQPSKKDKRECRQIVARVADDNLLVGAVEYFHRVWSGDGAERLNIKQLTLGYFRMALPSLVQTVRSAPSFFYRPERVR